MVWLNSYIKKIDDIRQSGADTELSYRAAIDNMLSAAAEKPATATLKILHEPKRQKGNAPDFRITNEGGAVVGYVECKKPGANLSAMAVGEQLKRYGDLSSNIILTDGWRWLLLRNGKKIREVTIGAKIEGDTKNDFINLLNIFFTAEAEKIGAAKRLAASLAARCELLRQELVNKINGDKGKLRGLFDAFRKLIYRDMTEEQFSDAFAQTTVYALLMAKLRAGEGKKPDLYTVKKHIPQTFALIRELSGFLCELDNTEYSDLLWVVDDILVIVNNMDVAAVIETMSYTQKTGVTDSDDPFLYFYENFLAAYNAKLRKTRGVYYTPLPVVRFIVRAVDDILKGDFGMKNGLADKSVTALDFATGTGTFILETMRLVLNDKSQAECKLLTKEHLLKNCYGFEFLIAPYAIAHLKLSQFLTDRQCGIDENLQEKQLKIFLTNTLEEASAQMDIPILPALSDEAKGASKIKKSPILVIMGNPPYSGHSQTASKIIGEREHKKIKGKKVKDIRDTWINDLLQDYYQVDGAPLGERNPKWLQDDYVKFIRFAQHKIQQLERGVVAIITNHGFLDNPTFRGMRQSLMNTFDQLYFLDLHGNAKKKETAPDGGKDVNVFDIQQGVGISLLIKNPALKKGVFHSDLFGKQQYKYNFCEAESIKSIKWRALKPESPFYLFIPQDKTVAKKYQKYTSINDIFNISGVGITTAHDDFVIDFQEGDLLNRFIQFANSKRDAETLHSYFGVKYKMGWDILRGYDALQETKDIGQLVKNIHYRPFDNRYILYEDRLVWRAVRKIMRHMLEGNNLALITQARGATSSLVSRDGCRTYCRTW